MSTDWIKMRVDLRTHPKVVRMSSALKADKLRVIGGLFAVWSIFDAHAVDGLLEGYDFREIDEQLGWRGFALAMNRIEWLTDSPNGLSAPRFDEHNGQSAKRRAMETERKRQEREAERAAAAEAAKEQTREGQPSASDADKSVTREEKRREEIKTPPTPKGEPPGFSSFWEAWPKSNRKGGRDKCLEVWKAKTLEQQSAQILAHVIAMTATKDWTKEGRQYVPAPVVYLRSAAWSGAEVDSATTYAGAI